MSCNLIQPTFTVIKFKPKGNEYDEELKRCQQTAKALTKSNIKKAFLIEGEHLATIM